MYYAGERESFEAGCGMRDAGCGMRNAGCGMRDAGCAVRDAPCGALRSRLLALGLKPEPASRIAHPAGRIPYFSRMPDYGVAPPAYRLPDATHIARVVL